MARGVNKVILVGNVGRDPEARYAPSGTAVVNFSLATSESWKDKNSGEQQERTEWHRCVAFGKLGEFVSTYVSKGSQLYVEGQLRTRKWQDSSGADRYTTEIVAAVVESLGARSGGGGQGGGGQGGAQGGGGRPQGSGQGQRGGDFTPPPGDDFDDDIPF